MKKIGIITDSHCGVSQAEAEKLGIKVLPMPIYIDDVCYYEDMTITHEEFFEKLNVCDKVSTSQASPADVMDLWNSCLEEYETILCMPMSSGLSGACNTAKMFAENEEYVGRVFVVDNGRISTPMHRSILDALELIEEGYSAQEIKDILEGEKDKMSIYIAVETLEYLKRGGRISKTVAFAGELLSIKPVVTIEDGEIKILGKARGSRQANNLLVKEIEQSGGVDFGMPVLLGYTGLSDVLLQKYISDSAPLWEQAPQALRVCCIGSVIGTHAGPGAVAAAYFRKG